MTYIMQRICSTVNSIGKQTGDTLKNKDILVIYNLGVRRSHFIILPGDFPQNNSLLVS